MASVARVSSILAAAALCASITAPKRWLVTLEASKSDPTLGRRLAADELSCSAAIARALGTAPSPRSLLFGSAATTAEVFSDGQTARTTESSWRVVHEFSHESLRGTAVVEMSEATARQLASATAMDVREDAIGWLGSLNAPIPVQQVAPVTTTAGGTGASTPTKNWGLDRLDQRLLPQFVPLDGQYWHTLNGSGVDVFVFDTGINMNHSEYADRIAGGYNLWPDQRPADFSDTCMGHGTAVASQAVGRTVGTAPGASLLVVRIAGCGGYFFMSDVLRAIEWTVEQVLVRKRPAVINLSGGTRTFDYIFSRIRATMDAMRITFIASGGNDYGDACFLEGSRTYYAGSSNTALTPAHMLIGATALQYYWPSFSRAYDAVAFFSNTGDCVDLYAPGYQNLCAMLSCDTCFGYWSGTSFSAPLVAGIAAVILQRYPNWTPDDIRASLIGGGTRNVLRWPSQPAAQAAISHNVMAYAPRNAADINKAGLVSTPLCPAGFAGPVGGMCYKGVVGRNSIASANSACSAAAPGATLAAVRSADQAISVISDQCGGSLLVSRQYWVGLSDAQTPSTGRQACCWSWSNEADPFYIRTAGTSWWGLGEPLQYTYDCPAGSPPQACLYTPRNAHCVVARGGKLYALPCDGDQQFIDACCEVPALHDDEAAVTSADAIDLPAAVCDAAAGTGTQQSWTCQLLAEGGAGPVTSSGNEVSGNDAGVQGNLSTSIGVLPFVQFTVAFNATSTLGALSSSVPLLASLRSVVATFFGQPATSVVINALTDVAHGIRTTLLAASPANGGEELGVSAMYPPANGAGDPALAPPPAVGSKRLEGALSIRVLQDVPAGDVDVPTGATPAKRTLASGVGAVLTATVTITVNATLIPNVGRSTETAIALALRSTATPVAMLAAWADMWPQFGILWHSFAIDAPSITFHTLMDPFAGASQASATPSHSTNFGLAAGLSVGAAVLALAVAALVAAKARRTVHSQHAVVAGIPSAAARQ